MMERAKSLRSRVRWDGEAISEAFEVSRTGGPIMLQFESLSKLALVTGEFMLPLHFSIPDGAFKAQRDNIAHTLDAAACLKVRSYHSLEDAHAGGTTRTLCVTLESKLHDMKFKAHRIRDLRIAETRSVEGCCGYLLMDVSHKLRLCGLDEPALANISATPKKHIGPHIVPDGIWVKWNADAADAGSRARCGTQAPDVQKQLRDPLVYQAFVEWQQRHDSLHSGQPTAPFLVLLIHDDLDHAGAVLLQASKCGEQAPFTRTRNIRVSSIAHVSSGSAEYIVSSVGDGKTVEASDFLLWDPWHTPMRQVESLQAGPPPVLTRSGYGPHLAFLDVLIDSQAAASSHAELDKTGDVLETTLQSGFFKDLPSLVALQPSLEKLLDYEALGTVDATAQVTMQPHPRHMEQFLDPAVSWIPTDVAHAAPSHTGVLNAGGGAKGVAMAASHKSGTPETEPPVNALEAPDVGTLLPPLTSLQEAGKLHHIQYDGTALPVIADIQEDDDAESAGSSASLPSISFENMVPRGDNFQCDMMMVPIDVYPVSTYFI